ncbi:MAG: acyltransferase [Gammaproteobacteria bacterium]|nr:MAG: acyltransferase [Gammaproteobacteria bacterium]
MLNSVSAKQPELSALTSLRGIAALFVLSHHFLFVLLDKLPKVIPSHLFYKSYLWVDLFFILSGFVLAYVYQSRFTAGINKSDYRHFMWARFARVYPLHIFMLMLFVAFETLQWWAVQQGVAGTEKLAPFTGDDTPFTLLTNLLMLQTFHWAAYWNQPAWSISAEWIIYFTVPWLILRLHRASNAAMGVSVIAVLLVIGGVEAYFGNLGMDYAGWPMLLRCFGEAVLGVVAFQCYRHGYWARIASARWALAAFIVNILLLALPIPGVISVAAFAWLVLCAARVPADGRYLLTWSPLVYLGKISFALYMFHWFLLDVLRAGSSYFTGKSLPENLSLLGEFEVFVAAALTSLGVAALLYHFVETPLRNKLLRSKA